MCRNAIFFILLLYAAFSGCQEKGASSKTPPDNAVEEADPEAKTVAEKPALTDLPRIETVFTTEYIMGRFEPADHPDFTTVDERYADEPGYYLRKDTYQAFQKMHEAALADGVNLQIVSATRNFERQKGIWEAKWTGKRGGTGAKNYKEEFPDPIDRARTILLASSMPGTSRHHWGTDVDLNSTDSDYFLDGEGLKIYNWLTGNASEFGFCQPYTQKGADRPFGYEEERWHWSYSPVSRALTQLASEKLTNEMISGFEGAETARQIDVVKEYVLGVNPDCK